MSTETATCTVCGEALDAQGRCPRCESASAPAAAPDPEVHPDQVGHVWTIQDWRPLLTLWLVIALGFSFTRLVVNGYDEQQNKLAKEYYAEGTRAMEAQQPEQAVEAFEGALVYSHDNFDYQLKLTDALLASGAAGEAIAQLHAFLDQRPTDAQVKLKLARLEARRHHVDEALRYYLEALEGDWPERTDPFPQRIAVRFESAEYLLQQGRRAQAEGALQALAAVLPVSWPEQEKLGDLFLRNGNAARALKVYQVVLDQDPENEAARMGAAKASLATSSYSDARHYLLAMKPPTDESRKLLAELDRLEALDPFAANASPAARVERTRAAFRIASRRMTACAPSIAAASPQVQERWKELQRWAGQLAPLMNKRKLRGRDDLIESTMRFAFQAEMAAEKDCGPASNASVDDEALLLLARERMGAVQ